MDFFTLDFLKSMLTLDFYTQKKNWLYILLVTTTALIGLILIKIFKKQSDSGEKVKFNKMVPIILVILLILTLTLFLLIFIPKKNITQFSSNVANINYNKYPTNHYHMVIPKEHLDNGFIITKGNNHTTDTYDFRIMYDVDNTSFYISAKSQNHLDLQQYDNELMDYNINNDKSIKVNKYSDITLDLIIDYNKIYIIINNVLQDSFNLKYNVRNDENKLDYFSEGDNNNSSEIKLKLNFKIKYKLFNIETFENDNPTSKFYNSSKSGNLKSFSNSNSELSTYGDKVNDINQCIENNKNNDYVIFDGDYCTGISDVGYDYYNNNDMINDSGSNKLYGVKRINNFSKKHLYDYKYYNDNSKYVSGGNKSKFFISNNHNMTSNVEYCTDYCKNNSPHKWDDNYDESKYFTLYQGKNSNGEPNNYMLCSCETNDNKHTDTPDELDDNTYSINTYGVFKGSSPPEFN